MEWSSLKRQFILSLVVSTTICALMVAGAWGQTGTTSVRGVVTDKSGASIVAAKVTLTNPQQGSERETNTGSEGEYEFLSLQPGAYLLAIEAP
ncbi:MAG TPA: carboxypeptidase-like regulatory domain-containing protein, partial [Methylomirabilota bacterium]|nr:carboxypeptidase-like regulatory domain-containing protein [Methylomirabilota bacterium]